MTLNDSGHSFIVQYIITINIKKWAWYITYTFTASFGGFTFCNIFIYMDEFFELNVLLFVHRSQYIYVSVAACFQFSIVYVVVTRKMLNAPPPPPALDKCQSDSGPVSPKSTASPTKVSTPKMPLSPKVSHYCIYY